MKRHPLLPDILLVPSVPPHPMFSSLDQPLEERSQNPFCLAPFAELAPQHGEGASTAVQAAQLQEPNPREDGSEAAAWQHVVVGRLCGEAVLRGADIFARGVLVASAGLAPVRAHRFPLWPQRVLPRPPSSTSVTFQGSRVVVWCDIDNAVLRGSDLRLYRGTRILLGIGTAMIGRSSIFRVDHGLAVQVNSRLTGACVWNCLVTLPWPGRQSVLRTQLTNSERAVRCRRRCTPYEWYP